MPWLVSGVGGARSWWRARNFAVWTIYPFVFIFNRMLVNNKVGVPCNWKEIFQSSTKNSSSPIFTLTTAEEKRAQVLVLQRERGATFVQSESHLGPERGACSLRITDFSSVSKHFAPCPHFSWERNMIIFFRIDFTPIGIDCTLKALQWCSLRRKCSSIICSV